MTTNEDPRGGLAIGYAVEDFPANSLDVPRKPIQDTVVFLDH